MNMEEKDLTIDDSRVKALFDECIQITRQTNDMRHKWYVFDNQIETAKEIIYNFYTKQNRWCLLFAEMQSGKSGTFFSIPYIISRNNVLTKKLDIDMDDDEINVYLLTGMNEKELIDQFETDISNFTGMDIKKNILHNSEMRKFLIRDKKDWSTDDQIVIDKMRKNSLILIDESHYGSDKEQILNKFLTKILDISPNGDNTSLINNNIYVVSISATPMAEFKLAKRENFKKKIISLKNSVGYYGISEMYKNNRIHKSFDLKDYKSVDSFIGKIKSKTPGYVLIRCNEKQKKKIYERLGESLVDFHAIDYDQYSKSRILDNKGINDIIKNKPEKHTLVFLKGLLRAGKRVDTKYVIMVHDTSESKVDTTVQSLLGRCCGYSKNQNIDIYCDSESALKYKNWVESGYDLSLVPNKSKNIKGKNTPNIQTLHESIIFDVSKNIKVLEMMRKSRKTKEDKLNLLRSLDNDIINEILISGVLGFDYDIAEIARVNKNKQNTSYKKKYLDVVTNKKFLSDYKPKDEDIDKKIFSGAFSETELQLVISFGVVIKNETGVDSKSMYY